MREMKVCRNVNKLLKAAWATSRFNCDVNIFLIAESVFATIAPVGCLVVDSICSMLYTLWSIQSITEHIQS